MPSEKLVVLSRQINSGLTQIPIFGIWRQRRHVSQSQVAEVISYIEKQEEHHRKMTFQEEYRLFLKRYRLAFDEQDVWDWTRLQRVSGFGTIPLGLRPRLS